MSELGTIGFAIRPRVEPSQAQRAIEDMKKRMAAMRTSSDAVGKSVTLASKAQEEGFKRVGTAAEDAGRKMERAFRPAIDVLDRVGRGMATIQSKFANLRTLFTTGIVGAVTVGGLMKVLRAGQANIEGDDRIRRKFRGEAGRILDIQSDVGFRTGRTSGEAQEGLSAILEAVQGTKAGTKWRGKKLTGAQADALRAQTFGVGRELFERIVALNPHLNAAMVGKVLAESAQNPNFGTARLASMLGLTRPRTKEIADAYRKGKLAELIGEEKSRNYGIKKGEKVGTGTLLELITDESGNTKQGLEDKKKRFDFQIRQMGSLLDTVIGDLGTRAFEKLNAGIAKGGNLAENLKAALESPKGREFIDKLATVITKVVEGIASVVRHANDLGSFIDKHKESLTIFGGLLVGSRVYTGVKGMVGGAPGLLGVGIANELNGAGGGLGGALEDARRLGSEAGTAATALSKFGTAVGIGANALGAFAAGWSLGKFLDETFDLANRIAGTRDQDLPMNIREQSREEGGSKIKQAQREYEVASSLARRIKAGLSPSEAAADFAAFAGQTEGTSTLTGFSATIARKLQKGDVSGLEGGKESFARAMEMFGQGARPIKIGDIKISVGGGQSLPEVLDASWPALKAEIIRKAETESGYGAAPMSSPDANMSGG